MGLYQLHDVGQDPGVGVREDPVTEVEHVPQVVTVTS